MIFAGFVALLVLIGQYGMDAVVGWGWWHRLNLGFTVVAFGLGYAVDHWFLRRG